MSLVAWHRTTNQVLDVDVAMEKIMNTWFEQRHENRRQLAKTIEKHRVIDNGDQRLDYARLGAGIYIVLRGLRAISMQSQSPVILRIVAGRHASKDLTSRRTCRLVLAIYILSLNRVACFESPLSGTRL